MPLLTGRRLPRPLSQSLALVALASTLAGCATHLPDLPSEPIDRLPFTRAVPLDGDQRPETEGGRVHAVRWTVLACPANNGRTRHIVIGTRGTTNQNARAPGALAALIVCDDRTGTWAAHKTQVHKGDGVSPRQYEPDDVPSLLLKDNTLEVMGFEPGELTLLAQPEDRNGAAVGVAQRFDVTVHDGTDWRQSVSSALARMREEAADHGGSTSASTSFAPAVAHMQY